MNDFLCYPAWHIFRGCDLPDVLTPPRSHAFYCRHGRYFVGACDRDRSTISFCVRSFGQRELRDAPNHPTTTHDTKQLPKPSLRVITFDIERTCNRRDLFASEFIKFSTRVLWCAVECVDRNIDSTNLWPCQSRRTRTDEPNSRNGNNTHQTTVNCQQSAPRHGWLLLNISPTFSARHTEEHSLSGCNTTARTRRHAPVFSAVSEITKVMVRFKAIAITCECVSGRTTQR